ncbi:hypothetical protein [Nostoc punctiforme]|uniref:hypothetical protein n=1 Tax=Nostoc punctiforme TaxID=272131 RepID=UPI000045BEB2|nr:hypothetical protein [Nostoc punctiforme]
MKTKRLLITLNDELYHQLQALSAINGLSMAAQVRYFISQNRLPECTQGLKVTTDD